MAERTHLGLERARQRGAEIVRVRGELDLTNTTVLEEALARLAEADVILDLSGLAFVDSAGIRTIDAARKRLRQSDQTLVLVAPTASRAGWTFRVAGFGADFVVESVDAAHDSLGERV